MCRRLANGILATAQLHTLFLQAAERQAGANSNLGELDMNVPFVAVVTLATAIIAAATLSNRVEANVGGSARAAAQSPPTVPFLELIQSRTRCGGCLENCRMRSRWFQMHGRA